MGHGDAQADPAPARPCCTRVRPRLLTRQQVPRIMRYVCRAVCVGVTSLCMVLFPSLQTHACMLALPPHACADMNGRVYVWDMREGSMIQHAKMAQPASSVTWMRRRYRYGCATGRVIVGVKGLLIFICLPASPPFSFPTMPRHATSSHALSRQAGRPGAEAPLLRAHDQRGPRVPSHARRRRADQGLRPRVQPPRQTPRRRQPHAPLRHSLN